MITYIIFSKDRPAQLDALLRSVEHYNIDGLYCLIFTGQGYFDTIINRDYLEKIRQENFKEQVLQSMANKYTCFLCDDMQFIDRFTPAGPEWFEFVRNPQVACLSLRLGKNINYSYPKQKAIQPPNFSGQLNIWEWQGRESYWGYPMSLDGHIFKTEDIKPMIEAIEFNNPNELEGMLAMDPIEKPLMICYDKPKVVNYPYNLVQDVCNNRNMGIDAELLNESYAMGARLKLMQPKNHNSCHVEQYPEWE